MSAEERTPDLEALRLLVTVAATGSLGQAAARHGITQPAVSLRLRTLERRLQLVLLERSPSGTSLTPAGRSVVDWARELLDSATVFSRAVTALAHHEHGRLPVAASLTIADHLMPGWLVALHEQAPQVAVALQVVNSERVVELVRRRDVALGYIEAPRLPRGLRSRDVGGDELVVVAGPAHPWLRRRRPLEVGELAQTPLLLRERGSGTRESLERALGAHGLTPRVALELGSTAAIKAATADGNRPAVLSRLAVTAELAAGRLREIPVAELDLRRRFHAVWRTDPGRAGPAARLLALSRPHRPGAARVSTG